MEMAFYVLVLVIIVLAAFQVMAARGFRARALALGARLRDDTPSVDMSSRLPGPVFTFARRSGARIDSPIRTVSLTQTVEMRRLPGSAMQPWSAWQVASTNSPGHLWEARQDAGPFTSLRTVEALVGGYGQREVRRMGSIPVSRDKGAEATLAEAYRYLADLPLLPDAILCNAALTWDMAGERTASVSMDTADGQTARVAFLFDEAGDIVAMRAKGRPARGSGDGAPPDWQGRYGSYATVGPRRIPTEIERGDVQSSGYEPSFRAKVTEYHAAV